MDQKLYYQCPNRCYYITDHGKDKLTTKQKEDFVCPICKEYSLEYFTIHESNGTLVPLV